MELNDKIGPLILEDFKNQNIMRLREWFLQFPNAYSALGSALGSAPLKYSLVNNMWLSSSFLLGNRTVTNKLLQIKASDENSQYVYPLLVQSHVQNNEGSKELILKFLHDRVRL